MRASFIYHQIHAILGLIVSIYIGYLLYTKKIRKSWQLALILISLAIMWGIHSLIHFREEKDYNFNPFE